MGGIRKDVTAMPASLRAEREQMADERSGPTAAGIIATLPDPCMLFDVRARITAVNGALEELLGFSRAELLEKTPDFLHAGNDEPFDLAERIWTVLLTGIPAQFPFSVRTREGSPLAVMFAIEPIAGVEGPCGAIGFARTAIPVDENLHGTEARYARAYEAEHEVVEQLRAIDEMKNSFLSALSHELRTPVTAILGLSRTIEREFDRLTEEEIREFMRRVSIKASKLDRLLNDLLDLDRVRLGMIEPIRRTGNIADLVRHVTEELETPERARIQLELEDVLIALDQPQAERIVENLIVNALTHTPPGTPVWVRTSAMDNGILLVVEDAGPGVPVAIRSIIFEPFQQADVAMHAPGVGIGLSLVARFAEIHGGRAWVEDRPGGGASFKVFLPNGPARN
jgi:PAS domain S-box-containing protein